MVARTFWRGSPRSAICSLTVALIAGSALAKATMCSYLVLSRTSRNRG
jgi:hypothetical protein